MRMRALLSVVIAVFATFLAPTPEARQGETFDIVIRGGMVYDGSGSPGVRSDVGIRRDRVVAVRDLSAATASTVIDASGMAVAPGFVNMLSWSTESLLVDGRSQGEIRQGVTTQIFGEGSSMGPLRSGWSSRWAT
jgi:N-acyl-D-amino-acid deacylase